MQINIKTINLNLTPDIKSFLEEKFSILEKLTQHIDSQVVELWLEIGKPSRHHRQGKVFYAEGSLRLPGRILRGEESDTDLRTAIDRVRDELIRQVKKYKGKKINQSRHPLL